MNVDEDQHEYNGADVLGTTVHMTTKQCSHSKLVPLYLGVYLNFEARASAMEARPGGEG